MQSSTEEDVTSALTQARPPGRHAPAGVLRGWVLSRPWAMAPTAFAHRAEAVELRGGGILRAHTSLAVGPRRRRRAYYGAGCSAGLGRWHQRPLRIGPKRSSTEEKATSALTRAWPSGRRAPAGILRGGLLGRPWAMAPAAFAHRAEAVELRGGGILRAHTSPAAGPASAGGRTTERIARLALGNGANSLCEKGRGGRALREKQPPRPHEPGRRPSPTYFLGLMAWGLMPAGMGHL